MCLIDHHHWISTQIRLCQEFSEQHSVSHIFYNCAVRRTVFETNWISNILSWMRLTSNMKCACQKQDRDDMDRGVRDIESFNQIVSNRKWKEVIICLCVSWETEISSLQNLDTLCSYSSFQSINSIKYTNWYYRCTQRTASLCFFYSIPFPSCFYFFIFFCSSCILFWKRRQPHLVLYSFQSPLSQQRTSLLPSVVECIQSSLHEKTRTMAWMKWR